MPSLTFLKRSSPSMHHLSLIQQRLQTRQFSSLPLINASNIESDNKKDSIASSFMKWISGIAVGSSLGLVYWYSTSASDWSSDFFKKPFFSFAEWSTETAESTVDGSRNAFHKLSLPDYSSRFIFAEVFRRKIFFNYEKRLRLRSPPEKVFEYFASFRTPEGELLMRPADLMRAVVPVFPPSESHLVRDGYLTGERSPGELRCDPSEFFMLFDMNSDGHISFKEYIFFVTLLSIPESSFSIAFKMFDVDNSGEIDKEEFKKVMALMRANNRQGSVHRDGLRIGLKVTGSVENGGLVEYFFGKDGKARLQHDKFVQFMRNLQDEMLRLEFDHYDYKGRRSISAKDFALSMVASADMSNLHWLLKRVDELKDEPHLREIRINFDEFKHFAELRRNLHPFSLALFSHGKINGLLTKDDFKRAASHPTGKKKIQEAARKVVEANKQNKAATDRTSKAFDEDTAIFINMSQELKEEGNRLFQKRDHEGAMLKYEKALNLLPRNHIDVAYLRSNMATCYMQMGLGEYPRAINECNLALEVSPKYSKALLKRARCYEALNRLDLAYRDVYNVLTIEPNNLSALEVLESVKKAMDEKGVTVNENELGLFDNKPSGASRLRKVVKEKLRKKKNKGKNVEKNEKSDDKVTEEKKAEDKVVVEEKKISNVKVRDKEVVVKTIEEEKKAVEEEKVITKTVKLVFGEDIRWAQLPVNCTITLVRDIVRDRFPGLKGILVKYRDLEGDLVTITTTEELWLAESSGGVSGGSLRFYIVEVSPDQEPAYEGVSKEEMVKSEEKLSDVVENGNADHVVEAIKGICVEDWIVQFARLFKNHVGFDSDSYLDLHELGMKLYSEAMEDAVTSEDAQELFEISADKFQEMAALALFNWGNVHMSRARKHVFFTEDGSRESLLGQIKSAYEWAQKEYVLAAKRYEEALKIKPDFHEGLLALGHQQFEQAKLCWYHAIGSKIDLENGPSQEVLELYNKAEDSMERGMQMWEEMEEQRLNGLSKFDKYKAHLLKMGLDGLFKDVSAEEAAEQAANMSSQIYLLWGTLLYERSVVEYKLGLPTWEECLEVAVEKFELAGASPTDIAVMIKNHCSNETALEGLGFKLDEIVQAWNEMYDVKRWQIGVPSFRLEPLFRRRAPKLHSALEHL